METNSWRWEVCSPDLGQSRDSGCSAGKMGSYRQRNNMLSWHVSSHKQEGQSQGYCHDDGGIDQGGGHGSGEELSDSRHTEGIADSIADGLIMRSKKASKTPGFLTWASEGRRLHPFYRGEHSSLRKDKTFARDHISWQQSQEQYSSSQLLGIITPSALHQKEGAKILLQKRSRMLGVLRTQLHSESTNVPLSRKGPA